MTIHLGTPQIIYVSLSIIGLILTTIRHGKPRSNESVWTSIVAILIIYPILIWGGFFR